MSKSKRWDDEDDDYEVVVTRPCDNKQVYKTERQAIEALNRIRGCINKYAREVTPVRAYFCDNPETGCLHFHLTSQPLSAPITPLCMESRNA